MKNINNIEEINLPRKRARSFILIVPELPVRDSTWHEMEDQTATFQSLSATFLYWRKNNNKIENAYRLPRADQIKVKSSQKIWYFSISFTRMRIHRCLRIKIAISVWRWMNPLVNDQS